MLIVALLSGCASGRADESRIAAKKDATQGAVLPGIQATKIIEEFFASTPVVRPAPTQRPVLASLALATRVNADGTAQDVVRSVGGGGTVYAVAEISYLNAGQTVHAVWRNAAGDEVGRSEVAVTQSTPHAFIPLPWAASGSGSFAVFVDVDGVLMNSLVFQVG